MSTGAVMELAAARRRGQLVLECCGIKHRLLTREIATDVGSGSGTRTHRSNERKVFGERGLSGARFDQHLKSKRQVILPRGRMKRLGSLGPARSDQDDLAHPCVPG